jgi:hypothetical protein
LKVAVILTRFMGADTLSKMGNNLQKVNAVFTRENADSAHYSCRGRNRTWPLLHGDTHYWAINATLER